MKIGEVAKATGLTISNIRFYEKKGLLHPERDQENQYREYCKEDVLQLKKIVVLRHAGISLEWILMLLGNKVTLEEVIKRQQGELKEQQEQLQGSILLCQALAKESSFETLRAEKYLTYVKEQQNEGKRFVHVEEFAENLCDYTWNAFRQVHPVFYKLYSYRLVRILLTIIWWCIPIVLVVERSMEERYHSIASYAFLVVWVVMFLPFLVAYWRQRESRKTIV